MHRSEFLWHLLYKVPPLDRQRVFLRARLLYLLYLLPQPLVNLLPVRNVSAPGGRRALVYGLGFGVWGLGFGVWGLGFVVWGLGFGVWGLGFGVWGVGVSGLGHRVWGSEFRVWGLKFKV